MPCWAAGSRSPSRPAGYARSTYPSGTGKVGIGHTRWATHGPANQVNAHPHLSADGKVAVVHNGIIDNAASLREALVDEGIEMVSDTDSEVLAHLVARSEEDTLESKVRAALAQIDGTYGVAVLREDFPDRIVVARNGSPLIIGVGKEMHVASDLAALVRYTTTVAHLDDGEMATLTATGFTTYTTGLSATRKAVTGWTSTRRRTTERPRVLYVQGDPRTAGRSRADAPRPSRRAIRDRASGRPRPGPRETRAIQRVKVLGCGSSLLRRPDGRLDDRAGGPSCRPMPRPRASSATATRSIQPDTLYVAVSQSGEIDRTLLAVQEIKRKGGRVIGLVNVVGSRHRPRMRRRHLPARRAGGRRSRAPRR